MSSNNLTPWEKVRNLPGQRSGRPAWTTSQRFLTVICLCTENRLFGDDGAIVGGLASIDDGIPVTVVGQQKRRFLQKENIKRNFGMPSPEELPGRLLCVSCARQKKFHRPVICFVDTPGAFCGIEAEEGGIGEAIARNLYEMSSLKVPILSIMIGEGGSGGAIAMAVGNEVWSMENSTYSVLSPEGFASILWKDGSRASEAAKVMKITAADLKELGVIEKVIREPEPASIDNIIELSEEIREMIVDFLKRYRKKNAGRDCRREIPAL